MENPVITVPLNSPYSQSSLLELSIVVINGTLSVMLMFVFHLFFVSGTDGKAHLSDLFNLQTLYSHRIAFTSVQSLWHAWNAVQILKYFDNFI